MKEILKIVADFYSIYEKSMLSKSRLRRHVLPRHVAIYIVRKNSDLSLQEIGGFFEKNHATVIHATKTINNLCETYPKFKSDIDFLLEYTSGVEIKKDPNYCRPQKFKAKCII